LVLALALIPIASALTAAEPPQPDGIAGINEPLRDLTLAFPVVGVVGSRSVQEGDAVQADQLLLELENGLEDLEVQRRRLLRDHAAAELQRLTTLSERKAISVSREELEKKRNEAEIARVEHELSLAMVRRRQLRSPIEGRVVQVFKDLGERCEDQQPVLRLVDTRRIVFVGHVEPQAARDLKIGQAVRLHVDGTDPSADLSGTLVYLSPVVDAASGLLRVKAEFENPSGRLRPGTGARLQLPGPRG
ncbi:MAG: efflux RND transporter periplasmic adaptor subunit, partial [Verrucomicrobiota bacterium]